MCPVSDGVPYLLGIGYFLEVIYIAGLVTLAQSWHEAVKLAIRVQDGADYPYNTVLGKTGDQRT
jgi:hypothetical protein